MGNFLGRFSGSSELRDENERLRREIRRLKGETSSRQQSPATSTEGGRLARDAVDRFKEVVAELARQPDVEQTLRVIVESILELTGGERAFVILREGGELRFQVAFDRDGQRLPEEPFGLSRTIAKSVARGGDSIVSGGVATDRQLAGIESVKQLGRVSVLCLPLSEQGSPIGSVYVDDRSQAEAFAAVDLDLVQSFVDLAGVVIARVRDEEERLREERLASLGLATSFVLHDLASPVSVIAFQAELLGERLGDDGTKAVERIREQCGRIEGMAKDVLDFCKGRMELARRSVRVEALVEALRTGLAKPLSRSGVKLVVKLDYDGALAADPDRLVRILENIGRNAIKAMGDGGTLAVRSKLTDGDQIVELRVSDTGPGIPEEDRERIFDPFFQASKGGTGIGLAMARQTVEAHGGTIEIRDARRRTRDGGVRKGGAELVIRLPRETDAKIDLRKSASLRRRNRPSEQSAREGAELAGGGEA